MRLHRAASQPDWEHIAPEERNAWQRIAARTSGWLTPGNVLTFAGLIGSLVGLLLIAGEVYTWGLVVIAVGRLCDVLDGIAAEATGTKGPLGEALDAGVDKLVTLAALVVLVELGIVPWPAGVFILLPNIVNTLLVLRAQRRHTRLHPSRQGKLAMTAMWVSLLGFVLAIALPDAVSTSVFWVSYVAAAGVLVLGVFVARGYARDLSAK